MSHLTSAAMDLHRTVSTAILVLTLGLLAPHQADAQQTEYTFSGRILDATTDEPLPGANVRLEESAIGTAADANGSYSLTIRLEPDTYTLIFSFVGYRSQRVPVTVGADQDIELDPVYLREDIIRGEEVVVTGTAAPTERRRLGNAVSTVDAQALEESGSSSIDRALQGKIAGAQIQQNSGNPAGGVSIRLRGSGTVLGSADPLYIIDGVIVNNDSPLLIDLGGGSVGTSTGQQNRLIDLDPNDIERIEVVKGAAAAALYGSRANNGVVQIFTKRGAQGIPRIEFTTRVRTDAVRKTLDVNTYGFDLPFDNPERQPVERYDFQDFIFRRAYGTEQHLSISGGSEGTRYYASGSHLGNEGVVEGSSFRRLNGRIRIDQLLSDWANVSFGASYSRSESQDVPHGGITANYGALTGFIFGPNTFDPRPDETGQYPNLGVLANPVEVIDRYDFGQTTNRFIGDVQAGLSLLDGMSLDYTLGLDTYEQTGLAFIPRGTSAPGLGGGLSRRSTRSNLQLNNDLRLSYQAILGDGIESTTLIGGTLQYENSETFSAQSESLSPVSRVVQSGTSALAVGESRSERAIYGAFAQNTFGFGDRLFLTVAGRADASSVFASGQRWQYYPKASVSYLISEERFWQNSALATSISSLKFRASVGASGGLTAIGAFDRFTTYSPQSFTGNPGLVPSSQLGAIDVRPERQREIELGLDAGFLDDRLGLEFTYYDQLTTDLLLQRSVAPSTGFLTRLQNIGELQNRGVELLVRALPVSQRNFRWSTTLTYSANRNEVQGLADVDEDIGILILGGFGLVGAIDGQPLGVFYGSNYGRASDDADHLITDEDGPIVDVNGNVLENIESGIPARAARNRVIGDPNPDWTASWTNEFTISRNLSIRAQLDAVVGQDVFNFTRRLAALSAFGTLTDWQRELEGDLPQGYNAQVFNIFEHWVEDGSFVKLRELSVSYTLRPRTTVERVRLRVSGRNLFSIDNYSGYDPEVNVAGQSTNVRNFDFVEVPIPRTFSIGVTLTM